MGALTSLSSLFTLVSEFGPLVPAVIAEVPDIAAKASKLAADVKSMNVANSIGDLEALIADAEVPFSAITKTVDASKSMTLQKAA